MKDIPETREWTFPLCPVLPFDESIKKEVKVIIMEMLKRWRDQLQISVEGWACKHQNRDQNEGVERALHKDMEREAIQQQQEMESLLEMEENMLFLEGHH